jgi:tetratricopeptide (TPR) repeat protein
VSYLPPVELVSGAAKQGIDKAELPRVTAAKSPELTKNLKKAQKYEKKGDQAFSKKKRAKALEYYAKALKYDPMNPVIQEKINTINAFFITQNTTLVEQDEEPPLVADDSSSEPFALSNDKKEIIHTETATPSFWSRILWPFSHKSKKDDPKEKDAIVSMLEDAEKLYQEKKYNDAYQLFEDILAIQPENEHALKRSVTIEMMRAIEDNSAERVQPVTLQRERTMTGQADVAVQKKEMLTQKKLVPAQQQVLTTPIAVNPKSASELYKPIDTDVYSDINKLLEKGEKYYRKGDFEKALTYYYNVLRYDLRNEQAQKMIKTIADIQRSEQMQKSLDSVNSQ